MHPSATAVAAICAATSDQPTVPAGTSDSTIAAPQITPLTTPSSSGALASSTAATTVHHGLRGCRVWPAPRVPIATHKAQNAVRACTAAISSIQLRLTLQDRRV